MGFSRPKVSGPSQAEIRAQQEAAARKERERLEAEEAARKAEEEQKFLAKEDRRRQFAAGAESETVDDPEARRKFLARA